MQRTLSTFGRSRRRCALPQHHRSSALAALLQVAARSCITSCTHVLGTVLNEQHSSLSGSPHAHSALSSSHTARASRVYHPQRVARGRRRGLCQLQPDHGSPLDALPRPRRPAQGPRRSSSHQGARICTAYAALIGLACTTFPFLFFCRPPSVRCAGGHPRDQIKLTWLAYRCRCCFPSAPLSSYHFPPCAASPQAERILQLLANDAALEAGRLEAERSRCGGVLAALYSHLSSLQ